jgi:hypothetical protein
MTGALSILAAIAALGVTAAPASAGSAKTPPPRTTQVVVLIGANDYGLMEPDVHKRPVRGMSDGTSNTMMTSGSRKPPNGIIAILIG